MSLYDLLNTVACFALLVYNLLNYRKKKELLSCIAHSAMGRFAGEKTGWPNKVLSLVEFWTVLEIFIFSCVQYMVPLLFNVIVGNLLNTGANYFGMVLFAPWVVVGLCLMLKIDPLAQMDLIAPAYPLALFFSKIACHFGGCCRGKEWPNGLYNPISRLIEFPAPFLEAGVALLLFIALLCVKSRLPRGTVFPIYLMVYSAIRFFTEFFRCEPEVFLGLKTYHFLCIVGVIVGAAEYAAARRYDAQKQRSKTKREG